MQQTATMWPELGSVAVITIEAFPQWKYTSCTHLSFCIAAAMATNCEEDEGGYIDRRPGGHLRGGGCVVVVCCRGKVPFYGSRSGRLVAVLLYVLRRIGGNHRGRKGGLEQ